MANKHQGQFIFITIINRIDDCLNIMRAESCFSLASENITFQVKFETKKKIAYDFKLKTNEYFQTALHNPCHMRQLTKYQKVLNIGFL